MKCIICSKESTLRCGGCHEVYYCGQVCQKKDHPRHRPKCLATRKMDTKVSTPTASTPTASTPTVSTPTDDERRQISAQLLKLTDDERRQISAQLLKLTDDERRQIGAQLLKLPADNPLRVGMSDFYAGKSDEEILSILMSDPDYKRRKDELSQLLNADTVRKLFVSIVNREERTADMMHNLFTNTASGEGKDAANSRGFNIVYQSTQAIVRAVKGTGQPGDFLSLERLTLDELAAAWPESVALKEYSSDDKAIFVTVSHVFPLKSLRSDLKDKTIMHSITAVRPV